MSYRDHLHQITYYDGTAVTDERIHRMTTTPTKEQTAARDFIAAKVHACLADADGVVKIGAPHESRGPLGGLSSAITLWVEDTDGTLHPVAISVYCDDRVKESMLAEIEAKREQAEEQERIRTAVLGARSES